jgi:hypothetical protein
MGTVGYISQLVVLAIGLLCIILDGLLGNGVKALLSLVAVVALVVPLALTGKIISTNKATIASAATGFASNVLYSTGASDGDEEDAAPK